MQLPGFAAKSLTVDPNRIMDLLWTKPDGTAQYWKLNATGVPTAKVSYPPL